MMLTADRAAPAVSFVVFAIFCQASDTDICFSGWLARVQGMAGQIIAMVALDRLQGGQSIVH